MRRSRFSNIWNAWSITTGYSAVVPAISAVSSRISSRRGLRLLTCSRHSRASRTRVVSRFDATSVRGVAASMARVYQSAAEVASGPADGRIEVPMPDVANEKREYDESYQWPEGGHEWSHAWGTA